MEAVKYTSDLKHLVRLAASQFKLFIHDLVYEA